MTVRDPIAMSVKSSFVMVAILSVRVQNVAKINVLIAGAFQSSAAVYMKNKGYVSNALRF